jgi:parallel beta-helix repeat protein
MARNWIEGNDASAEGNVVTVSIQSGIYLQGSRSLVAENRVSSTGMLERLGREDFGGGYCKGNGIEFYGDGNLIEENHIDSSCQVFDDGAGIYCWSPDNLRRGQAGSLIRKNTVLNSLGSPQGTPNSSLPGNGISIEHRNSGDRVEGNTVANADTGIYLHDAANVTVSGNPLYGNRSMQVGLKRDYHDIGGMTGNRVARNLYYANGPGQETSAETRYEVPDTGPLAYHAGYLHCREDSAGLECKLDSVPALRRPGGAPALLLILNRDSLAAWICGPGGLLRFSGPLSARDSALTRRYSSVALPDAALAPPIGPGGRAATVDPRFSTIFPGMSFLLVYA